MRTPQFNDKNDCHISHTVLDEKLTDRHNHISVYSCYYIDETQLIEAYALSTLMLEKVQTMRIKVFDMSRFLFKDLFL